MADFRDSAAYIRGRSVGDRFASYALSDRVAHPEAHREELRTLRDFRARIDERAWSEWTGRLFPYTIAANAAMAVSWEVSPSMRGAQTEEQFAASTVLALMRWRTWLEAGEVNDEGKELDEDDIKWLFNHNFVKGFVDGVVAAYAAEG